MPIVNIKLAKPELDKNTKEQLMKDITELLATKYNKAKERIVVQIEDIEAFNIAFGGETVEKLKAKK
ncbi:4-oxalocrotonate tautomerase family protein [uncultured Campylobacter sp.]|uniref:tautomerase family protein n=1 Tax=uncultured Campylobacter sp. TaxID=218934 RepID=UPI00261238E7|nr:4-oxalocrotonate tautomerase family protein [uncultured Campylobacter sp.]